MSAACPDCGAPQPCVACQHERARGAHLRALVVRNAGIIARYERLLAEIHARGPQ